MAGSTITFRAKHARRADRADSRVLVMGGVGIRRKNRKTQR